MVILDLKDIKKEKFDLKGFYEKDENSQYIIQDLLKFIKSKINFDASQYRSNYLKRRLYWRINYLPNLQSVQDYLAFVNKNFDEELPFFQKMLSINVTEFFRDIAPFRYVEKVLLKKISDQKNKLPLSDPTIRILSAACSSGEEPYSLAIIADFLRKKAIISNPVEILGIDIKGQMIQDANTGIYSKNSLKNISEKSLGRNFRNLGDGTFKIKLAIQAYCKFKQGDLFTLKIFPKKFDLILCRNFLIYISKDKQIKIVEKLLKNLNPNGYIIFGKTEGIYHSLKSNYGQIQAELISENIFQFKT
ncbi:MAG: CheR family methyltransferase [Promethearchaeota archaeon]